MRIARLTGKLLPEILQIHGVDHPTIHWRNKNTNLHVDMDIKFEGSKVTVECKLHQFDDARDMSNLIANSTNFAQLAINLSTLVVGDAPVIVMDKLELPDGRIVDLYAHEHSFTHLASAIGDAEGFTKILRLAIGDPNMLLAIRDLADSIRYTNSAEINCARAVEAGRVHFQPGDDKKRGWQAMNAALNLSPEYTGFVTTASQSHRHGDRRQPADDPREIGRRAWTVMTDFLNTGSATITRLPIADFPHL